jgi:hypothetical protein
MNYLRAVAGTVRGEEKYMVSRGDKRSPASFRKRKAGIIEALLADPVDISVTKAEKAAIRNLRSHRRSSVVSAIVYNDKPTVIEKPAKSLHNKNHSPTQTASIFPQTSSNLTFTTKLRNVIQFVLESLRETIALSKPTSTEIEKSIREMRALSVGDNNPLNEEIKRHLAELIEETEAFVSGEKTQLTGITDFQSAMHYRHYVRIAWLANFILNNAPGSVLGRRGGLSAEFPPNS